MICNRLVIGINRDEQPECLQMITSQEEEKPVSPASNSSDSTVTCI